MTTIPLIVRGALARVASVDDGGLDEELPARVIKDAEGSLLSMHTRVTKVAQETSDDN